MVKRDSAATTRRDELVFFSNNEHEPCSFISVEYDTKFCYRFSYMVHRKTTFDSYKSWIFRSNMVRSLRRVPAKR